MACGVAIPYISIVIPTVSGREDHYARCVQAYTDLADGNYHLEIITEVDHPAVGMAWQAGAMRAQGDFTHLTNDDIEPLAGWHMPAVDAVESGFMPAPQVYGPDGNPQSHPSPGMVSPDWTPVHMSALPFFSTAMWQEIQPLFTAHYFTDDFCSQRSERAGWPCRLRTGYAFRHWYAQHKRGAGMSEHERMVNDEALYKEAIRRVDCGEWDHPWPPRGGLPE